MATKSDSVKVAVRVRPFSAKERKQNEKSMIKVDGGCNRNQLCVESKDCGKREFIIKYGFDDFDHVFGENTNQKDIYTQCVSPIIQSVLRGYNGTIFVYGQSGTGKTYTMEGDINNNTNKGIIPRAFTQIMDYINNSHKNIEFSVHVSYLEIYKDEVYDLLNKNKRKKLMVKEGNNGFYVKDLSMHSTKSVNDMFKIFRKGQKARSIGSTSINPCSSRSHCILSINIESSWKNDNNSYNRMLGKMNLVDLAGFERQKKTQIISDETKFVNSSLSALGNVIYALTNNKVTHIPYRDSKLTRLLSDSLGGHTKTVMIANISASSNNLDETLSTLRYANRAKDIQNKAQINENQKKIMISTMKMEPKGEKRTKQVIKKSGQLESKSIEEKDDVSKPSKIGNERKCDIAQIEAEKMVKIEKETDLIIPQVEKVRNKTESKICTFINQSTPNAICQKQKDEIKNNKNTEEEKSCSVETDEKQLSVAERKLIADTYYDVTQKMIQSLHQNKDRFSLLKTATYITGPDKMIKRECCDANYWDNIRTATLEMRLDFDYDEWMQDSQQHQRKVIHEVSEILHFEPKQITITNLRRGSTIFDIKFNSFWIWFNHKSEEYSNEVEEYVRNLKVQDQISVAYKDKWYNATVSKIFDDGSYYKPFQVRYNPQNDMSGWDPFYWNTEWFYDGKESKRWRFEGQPYTLKNLQGESFTLPWKTPKLAQPHRSHVNNIQVNDHIFVDHSAEQGWSRCIVYKKTNGNGGYSIYVKSLRSGKTQHLDLWNESDKNKVSFIDMR